MDGGTETAEVVYRDGDLNTCLVVVESLIVNKCVSGRY